LSYTREDREENITLVKSPFFVLLMVAERGRDLLAVLPCCCGFLVGVSFGCVLMADLRGVDFVAV